MSKRHKKKKATSNARVLGIAAALVALVAAVIALCLVFGSKDPTQPQQPTYSVKVDGMQQVDINLGYGLEMEEVGKYTGVYMEDGSDEVVSGILMVIVKNNGPQDIQYAEVELPVGKRLATFTLTNVAVGQRVVLLEKNRMEYVEDAKYATAIIKNVVVFQTPMGLCSDKVKVQGQNGVLNITNISGEDITGDVIIYYKNSSVDLLYGGITYRVVIRGGLAKGETRQIPAGHYSTSGSRIVHITCGEAA